MLSRSGHELYETTSAGLRVCPSPDTSIVVAIDADVTLYPAYRQRFFLCQPGAEDILTRAVCPVSIRQQWGELLVRLAPDQSRKLLAGPGAWTLTRLVQNDPILIWGVGSGYWEQSYRDTEYELIESKLGDRINFGPWRKHLTEGASKEAYCLNPGDDQFAVTLAAYFLLSSYNHFEFYLTNTDCTEVYEIHHHDEVTASIPDPDLRQQVLEDLIQNQDIYTDISGYQLRDEWENEDKEEETGYDKGGEGKETTDR